MKKVIFISALAIAAAVSCTKSDIVDTKFNEAISFETYTGRDAMTKATVATDATKFGIYGYYTGTQRWGAGENEIATPTANLWANVAVTNGNPATTKYWTNATDLYSFLAYAPYSEDANSNVTAPSSVTGNPVVAFAVPNDLTTQSDFIYSNERVNITRGDVVSEGANKGTVLMPFKHALSRITVRASETHKDYTYTITGLKLEGNFITSNNFDLKTGEWATATPAAASYSFVLPTGGVAVPNDTEGVAATPVDCVTYKNGTQYLMVIPTTVTDATLAVTYYTTYGTIDSAPITKTVKVSQAFAKGTAYALNLVFGPNPEDAITFSVDVNPWGEETVVTPNPENPEQGA